MTQAPAISVVITTFNREKFIEETIESFDLGNNHSLELVVFDGASTDKTASILGKLSSSYKNLKYEIGTTNSGIDKDLEKSAEMASGDYIWFMSSDDVVDTAEIKNVLSELKSGMDIYLLSRHEADKRLKVFNSHHWHRKQPKTSFDFKLDSDRQNYFDASISIGALFSFAPCIIVKRDAWQRLETDKSFYKTNYAHAGRLLRILDKGAKIQLIQRYVVICRMDNESFSYSGLFQRFKIDFDGYLNLLDTIFSDQDYFSACKVVRREHGLARLTKLRAYCSSQEWSGLKTALKRLGYPTYLLTLASIFGKRRKTVMRVVKLLRILRRREIVPSTGQWDK